MNLLRSFSLIPLNQRIIFAFLSLFYCVYFLPAELYLDSASMYEDAVNLRYVDYWPPLTLTLWHALNLIKSGGDLMLVINFLFLWSSVLIGLYLLRGQKISYFFLVIPFVPSIFIDAGHILKDTIISFGYMFIVMVLSYHTIEQKKLTLMRSGLLIAGIFYFSMVKIQAYYFFALMVFWIIHLKAERLKLIYQIVMAGLISLGLYGGMHACNKLLIKQKNDSHFWQYVKIYDLAGMSVIDKKMYLPQYLFKNDQVKLSDIENHYDYLWEPLIRYDHSPLISTTNDVDRIRLRALWTEMVIQHPVAYIKHRTRLWIKILGASSLKGKFVAWAQGSPLLMKFAPLFSLFSFLPLFPLFLYFLVISFKNFNTQREAVPAFILSAMGLILIFVLYIFSLAAAGRYIYFSWNCFMFSVPFIYRVREQNKLKRNAI